MVSKRLNSNFIPKYQGGNGALGSIVVEYFKTRQYVSFLECTNDLTRLIK